MTSLVEEGSRPCPRPCQVREDTIDRIEVSLHISALDGAGTNGEVYLVIGGREFNLAGRVQVEVTLTHGHGHQLAPLGGAEHDPPVARALQSTMRTPGERPPAAGPCTG
jgi:hypothetical protein